MLELTPIWYILTHFQLTKDKNYLGLWRSSSWASNSLGCWGGLLAVTELDPLIDTDWALTVSLPSPLNILEGFFIISWDTINGEVIKAGAVVNGVVFISEFLASVKEKACYKWNYQIMWIHHNLLTVCQKLGMILVIKWFKNWSYQKIIFTMCS